MRSSLFWDFMQCRLVAGYHPHHSLFNYIPKCSGIFLRLLDPCRWDQ